MNNTIKFMLDDSNYDEDDNELPAPIVGKNTPGLFSS